MMTTNKFSNSYGFNFNNAGGVTSPRMTNTTQFGHAGVNIPEEEQIDIEYSIEERIEENISKLEAHPSTLKKSTTKEVKMEKPKDHPVHFDLHQSDDECVTAEKGLESDQKEN